MSILREILTKKLEFRLVTGTRAACPVHLFHAAAARKTFDFKVRAALTVMDPQQHSQQPEMATVKLLRSAQDFTKLPHGVLVATEESHEYSFRPGEFAALCFRIDPENFPHAAVQVQVAAHSQDGSESHYLSAFFVPSSLQPQSSGLVRLPLLKGSEVFGEYVLDYLLVMPFRTDTASFASPSMTMPPNKFLMVGHRGLGISHIYRAMPQYQPPPIVENSIPSFLESLRVGADFVEFDVQVSQDDVPVIFHDFKMKLSFKSHPLEAPIKNMKLSQIQSIDLENDLHQQPRLSKAIGSTPVMTASLENLHVASSEVVGKREPSGYTAPSLEEVLTSVPESLGFNIEIKYPVAQRNEAKKDDWADKNKYIDTILKVVHEHAGNRSIFFSSFEPDICTLLQLKQNRFPVLFLTCSGTERYGKGIDDRTNSINSAVQFARFEGLAGIVAHSTPVVQQPELIDQVVQSGVTLLTWGDQNNILENLRLQKERGVHGVIMDNIQNFVDKV